VGSTGKFIKKHLNKCEHSVPSGIVPTDPQKRGLNSSNAFYHSVQNFQSSRLLPKNVKIRTHKTIIFPVVLHGCETWSLTLREAHRLKVFENRVLRRIFGLKWDEVTEGWSEAS
jgi:hypothetical protein